MKTLGCVLSLALAATVAVLAGPLVLGTLFPGEAPKKAGEPAVLRVMASPDEYYRVERDGVWWQFWREREAFVARVDKGQLAKDHPVRPTSQGTYEFTVKKVVSQRGEGYEEASLGWEGDLRAILYVRGEISTCDTAPQESIELSWREGDGTGRLGTRALCGRYRWATLIPGYLTVIAGITGVVLFLAVVGLVGAQEKEAQERREAEKRRDREERARQRRENERRRVESLLRRNEIWEEIDHMSGQEFERFVADILRHKGYAIRETRTTGDQGVDLVVNVDGKKVAVQLKRWAKPVGNRAVQATFAGMTHYQADEGWVITTSTFTKSARELARSTRVRLIDRRELAEWLEDLGEGE